MADPFDYEASQGDNPLDRPDLEDIDYQEEYDRPDSADPSDHQASSHTSFIMDGAKVHGATPSQDEYDSRDIYDYDSAAGGINAIVDILATRIAPDGSPIATDRAELLWGMVHALESQSRNLQYRIDQDLKEHEDLRYTEGLSEVSDEALAKVLHRLHNYNDRADAFTRLRQIAASRYRHHTGEVWRSRRRTDTAAASPRIDMRDFKKSREWRNQHDGIRIAITGTREAPSPETVRQALDELRQAHGRELVIVHGGHKIGIDAIAAEWAREHDVRTAVYRPNFKDVTPHVALARRNRQMVKDGLTSVLSFSPARIARASDVVVQARKGNVPVEIVQPGSTRTQRLASATDSLAAWQADPTAARRRSEPDPAADPDELRNTLRQRPNTYFDQDETTRGLRDSVRILVDSIAPDGYQLEDQREGLLWGFVNVFNEQTKRLDRAIAAVNRDTEIAPTDKEAAREALLERKHVFEELHSAASALYFDETRRVWDTKARDKLAPVTSTKLEFEAFAKNRERSLHAAQAPEGAVVIVHGDKIEGKLELFHYEQLSQQLDAIREKHGEIIVAHGAYSQGVDKLTAMWCENHGVSQIQCPPKYGRYKTSNNPAARAAFERNREMFTMPDVRELVIFGEASTGTAANMLELAEKRNENTLRHAQLLAEMDPEARERNGWVGPPVPVPVNHDLMIEITRARFDPAQPERTAINDRYVELLEAAQEKPQLIPYQENFQDFHELLSQAIASQNQPPAYTRKLIELDRRLTADVERAQEIRAVQNDIVDLGNQLGHFNGTARNAGPGFAESTPHYDAFVDDCTRCLERWHALQADPDMQPHLEHLAVPFMDSRIEGLSQHARYTPPVYTAAPELAEAPAAQSEHPIVRGYAQLLEQADNKPALLAYQSGFQDFRETVRRAKEDPNQHPDMVQSLNLLALALDKSDTERSQARSLSQRLLAHSREALALETWAGDQPGRKIQDSDKFENWRKDADALLDEYRQMSRNRSMAPHINDREEARTFFDRRIAYISDERFAALPKPDPTQQKALQAQQTQEAQQDQGMTMSL